MQKNFKTLRSKMELRWKQSAELAKIPEEGYQPRVKIVKCLSGESHFTFGIILNNYRFLYSPNVATNCQLCEVVEEVKETPERNLDRESKLHDYIAIPNKFPIAKGVSIAIHVNTGDREQSMFSTIKLDGLEGELENIFEFASINGFQAYHNGDGLGASVTRHEHWHLTNYGEIYTLAGNKYGFDASDYESLKTTRQIKSIPNFPFAHLIFDKNDPGRIVSFLKKIGLEKGMRYETNAVPHSICQSIDGKSILVVPAKNYQKKGIGSGETAGHFVVKTQEEFEKADYNFCLNILNVRLFSKKDLDLTKFL